MTFHRYGALSCVFACAISAAPNDNVVSSLQKADHYADFYNWAAAKPLFALADRALRRGTPDQIHAHVGYLRSTMETRSLPHLSNDLSSILQSATVASNPRLRLWCLEIKGDVDGEMDSASARADWEEAHRVATELGDRKWESRSLAEAGFSAYLQGDIATGRRNVAAALGTAHRTGDIGAEIRYLSAIGTGLEWNGSYAEALGYFEKAIVAAKHNPDSGYPFLAVAGQIETLIKEREFQHAKKVVKEASDHATERDKLIKLTQLMLFDADIEIGENHLEQAINILTKMLPLAERNRTRLLADGEMKLAKIYRQQHQLALAERYATEAFAHTTLTNDLFTAPARLEFAADLQWDLNRRSQARRSILQALEISEGLLAQTSNAAVREGLLSEMSSAYETAFKFAAQSNDVAGAFSIVERVRGRITMEILAQPQRPPQRQADVALEDGIRNLKVQLIRTNDPGERARIVDQLFYAEQQRYVEDRPAPIYTTKLKVFSLKRVTQSIGEDEAVLEYILPERGNAYCLYFSHKGTAIVQLGPTPVISALAESFSDDLRHRKPWKKDARALYDAVLAPVPEAGQYRKLTIVPDGNLHLIPFDALLNPSGEVIAKSTITAYATSVVGNLLLKSRTQSTQPNEFLGIGGAVYSQAGIEPFALAKSEVRGAYVGVDLAKLPNLPGSLEEVQTVANILRSTGQHGILQVGNAATKFAFKHAPLTNFQVIHLAIHAVANRDDPSRAALIFPPDLQHGDDGLMDTRQIAELRFGAQVIVLSACDTAVGRLQGQAGVANLARAFLQAGAESVVSTLWPIDDVRSLFLMKAFYRQIAAGQNAATALALAKREMLRESGIDGSPSDWAGFILLGNGDATLRAAQSAAVHKVIAIQ